MVNRWRGFDFGHLEQNPLWNGIRQTCSLSRGIRKRKGLPRSGPSRNNSWPLSRRVCAARIRQSPQGGRFYGRRGRMDGVKALVVLASIYYPGDGIVAKNTYQTSSGQRYDQSAPKCAALKWPLGT